MEEWRLLKPMHWKNRHGNHGTTRNEFLYKARNPRHGPVSLALRLAPCFQCSSV
jgi:hypothetical protein